MFKNSSRINRRSSVDNLRYRYYFAGDDATAGPILRLPAAEIETAVLQAVTGWLTDEAGLLQHLAADPRGASLGMERARARAAEITQSPREHLAASVQRVEVWPDHLAITIPLSLIGGEIEASAQIEVPIKLKRYGHTVRLIVGPGTTAKRREEDTTIVALLARAYDWYGMLMSESFKGISDVARHEGVSKTYAARVIHLALIAPDIAQRIARQEHPLDLTAERLMRLTPLPEDWGEQRRLLGIT